LARKRLPSGKSYFPTRTKPEGVTILSGGQAPDQVETWMTAPPGEALELQRPLPDGSFRIGARGVKEDNSEPSSQGR